MTAQAERWQKVAVPQAQFLRQRPGAGFCHHHPWFQCQLPLTKLTKPETRLTGSSVCCKSAPCVQRQKENRQMPEGITSALIFSFAADYLRIQCLAAAIPPSEIHSATGRINKLSTWLSGVCRRGDAGVNIPAKPQCPAAQRRAQHLPGVWRQWNNTTQRLRVANSSSPSALRFAACETFAHLPVRQPEN